MSELTPEEQAVMDEAMKVMSSAEDKLNMEGLFNILARLGLTLTLWRKLMKDQANPFPDQWIDEAAMNVMKKFFPA